MRRFAIISACLVLGLASAADEKGTKVNFDDLSSTTPATWEKDKPTSFMRFAQFKLPKKGDDKEDAEVVIFAKLGGSAKANVDRWKSQFKPAGGKSIDDVAKLTELKVAGCAVTRLEVEGTWSGSPTKPGTKADPKPGYKGIFYQFEGPENPYHIRLVGPAKTVEEYKKGYDEWVKGFKK
jgi:hypothetical protein